MSGQDDLLETLPGAHTRDRIHLAGLTFEGRHGWYDAERERLRPFTVDVTVAMPLDVPSRTDRLADTLDYNLLAETVLHVGTTTSHRLIERLAGAMADAILEACPVEAVQVTVHKPTPAVAGDPTAAAVTLYRSRGGR